MLEDAFKHYKSFAKAKVVNSKTDIKSRGFGFVSFIDPMDCAKALREMNGKYLGSRCGSIVFAVIEWQVRLFVCFVDL